MDVVVEDDDDAEEDGADGVAAWHLDAFASVDDARVVKE